MEAGRSDSIHFIEDFKLSLYDDEILVISKDGTSTLLPLGATVLDFAIERLDEKGLTCTGAMINKRFVPLDYTLQNSDQIDLLLTGDQKVSQQWLSISKTAKGRRVLKQYFRKEYLTTLQDGKNILKKKQVYSTKNYCNIGKQFAKIFLDNGAREILDQALKLSEGVI